MSELHDNVVPHEKVRSLRDAIRKVRIAEMERTDVVVGLQESERTRLELLSEELIDVFKEVPEDDDQFAFQIVPGTQLRLWIDMTSHVLMGRDQHSYRFVKETRLGRMVLLETADIDDMADCITEYIAERVIEKERALEADWMLNRVRQNSVPSGNSLDQLKDVSEGKAVAVKPSKARDFIILLCGLAVGIAVGGGGLVALALYANPFSG
ncbi:hypothetical protein PsAD2_02750 [Pseudovibrio axinellae]|uniref:Uncharacterized protein n=1 Tax=Pseudovibrio axinellae TaxID=989403 RepID=A0A165XT87_9HYPH|nr:hypothetical protein [Pseudovibrio axinellae]KZL18016.1 hypothetical protein PsAD2_02750 [Pseudovibrio axinellae]SER13401.1 hypothetical protein SAMN05421798_106230 [Pseudovibrio axinellae]